MPGDKAKQRTVGGKKPPAKRSPWQTAFLWSMMAVAGAVVVLLLSVAGAFGSSGAKSPAAADTGTSAAATTSPVASSTRPGAGTAATKETATAGATATPPAGTAPGDPDTTPLVRCGDPLAPVDKQHRLAQDCAPSDLVTLPGAISAEGAQSLRTEAASAIEELFAAARKDGFQLLANSTYRSYQTQVDTYNYWVRTSGQEYADRTSARAGHSEHQMGTAADVGTDGHFLESFIGTPAAKWLADNSWKYGFIVSYPDGKEQVTGYASEPWHIRYVGKDVAAKVHASGLTLHEYLLR